MPDAAPPAGTERDTLMKEFRDETGKLSGEWRDLTLSEIRTLLEEKLG